MVTPFAPSKNRVIPQKDAVTWLLQQFLRMWLSEKKDIDNGIVNLRLDIERDFDFARPNVHVRRRNGQSRTTVLPTP